MNRLSWTWAIGTWNSKSKTVSVCLFGFGFGVRLSPWREAHISTPWDTYFWRRR